MYKDSIPRAAAAIRIHRKKFPQHQGRSRNVEMSKIQEFMILVSWGTFWVILGIQIGVCIALPHNVLNFKWLVETV